MDLNLVTAFVEVVEAQSFTGAAKSLGLPKSSVSRRVTELEKELGVPLLHRTTRKLSLSDAGRAYFERAERALAGLDAAAEVASGMDAEPRGIVRVTAPVDLGVMGLAELIGLFTRQYPDIHVDFSLNTRMVDLVEEGFDIGIRAGKSNDASLIARRVGNASLGMFASPRYLKERGQPRNISELSTHDAVLFRGQDGKALWRLDGPNDEVSTVEMSGRVNADEMLFVRQAITAGLGIGLLPIYIEKACVEARKVEPLERVMPDYAIRGAEITVVTATGPKRPRRVTLLRDFLVEQMSGRCPGGVAWNEGDEIGRETKKTKGDVKGRGSRR
jgi:DNA-binding transcriptional LysR family regulator